MTAPAGLLAAASSAIAAVLTGPARPARVLAAFPAAVYLEHDAGVLVVVAADGIAHPNAVVLTAPVAARPLAGAYRGQPATVGAGGIEVGGNAVSVTRWFDPVPRLRATSPEALTETLAAMRALLVERHGRVPQLSEAAGEVADALLDDDVAAAVAAARTLVGAGPGLTPSGDDVLAGLFAAVATLVPATGRTSGRAPLPSLTAEAVLGTTRRVGADVVAHARTATTTVSAELLHHAVRGEVAAPAAATLHALTGQGSLPVALDALLAVGATSGRDLAVGLTTGAGLVLAAAGCPAATPRLALATTAGGH